MKLKEVIKLDYKNGTKCCGVELDDDDCIIDDEEGLLIDDGDLDDCTSFIRVGRQLNGVFENEN